MAKNDSNETAKVSQPKVSDAYTRKRRDLDEKFVITKKGENYDDNTDANRR